MIIVDYHRQIDVWTKWDEQTNIWDEQTYYDGTNKHTMGRTNILWDEQT